MPHAAPGCYEIAALYLGQRAETATRFTFLVRFCARRECRLAGPPDPAPGLYRQAETLPHKVRRQNQKPGNAIAATYLRANCPKKLAVAISTVRSKHTLTYPEDGHGHQDQPKKQQAGEKSDFLADGIPEGGRFRTHVQRLNLCQRISIVTQVGIHVKRKFSFSLICRVRRLGIFPVASAIDDNAEMKTHEGK